MTTEQIYESLLALEAGDMPLGFRMRSEQDAQSLQDLLGLLVAAFGKLSEAKAPAVQAMIEGLGIRYD